MTNTDVRMGWSMALSNGKGLLKKGDGERYKHASRLHSVTFEFVSLDYFDHFLDDAGMNKTVDVC
jgi:hypothetical protein